MINYDKDRGVEIVNEESNSVLYILNAESGDSGNYTCAPSNAKPASITLHILHGM